MKVSVVNDGFKLNGVSLEPIKMESAKKVSLDLATTDKITVRLHFLPTVKIADGRPRLKADEAGLREYARNFPKVTEALGFKDAIATLKPITFEIRSGPEVVEFFEETMVLFSSNPDDIPRMRKVELQEQTILLSTNKQATQPMDLQYRGLRRPATELDLEGTLQILYVRRGGDTLPHVLGAFLICSRPSGDFEYYKLPADRLDAILDPEDALLGPNRAPQVALTAERKPASDRATATDKTTDKARF